MVKLVNIYTTRRRGEKAPPPWWPWRSTKWKGPASEPQQPSYEEEPLSSSVSSCLFCTRGNWGGSERAWALPEDPETDKGWNPRSPAHRPFSLCSSSQGAGILHYISTCLSQPLLLFVLLFSTSCFVAGAPWLLDLGVGRKSQDKEVHNDPGSLRLSSSSGL